MFRVPKISLGSQLRSQLGMWHSEDLTERKGHATTWLPNRREQEHIQTLVGCDKLRDVVEIKSMIWTESILRPEAGMVSHHTVIQRAHVGWLEEDSWNRPELQPRGAIIAKRSGYCTTIAYVPSPTQFLMQLPGSESSSGESPLTVQGMDFDTTVYVHCGEVWVRRTCREQQEIIAGWHRLEELSDALHPAQKGCCQPKEARGTAGNRNADKPVLDEYYTGIRLAWTSADLLGLRPGAHWPRCSYCWRRTLLFGTCEECVGAPCLRYCCRTFDGQKLCPEHWPRRPDRLGQRQQIWPAALELDACCSGEYGTNWKHGTRSSSLRCQNKCDDQCLSRILAA